MTHNFKQYKRTSPTTYVGVSYNSKCHKLYISTALLTLLTNPTYIEVFYGDDIESIAIKKSTSNTRHSLKVFDDNTVFITLPDMPTGRYHFIEKTHTYYICKNKQL